MLHELDAINARRECGEITADEAEALGETLLGRVHGETVARAPSRRAVIVDWIKLVLVWTTLVLAVVVGVVSFVIRLQQE